MKLSLNDDDVGAQKWCRRFFFLFFFFSMFFVTPKTLYHTVVEYIYKKNMALKRAVS